MLLAKVLGQLNFVSAADAQVGDFAQVQGLRNTLRELRESKVPVVDKDAVVGIVRALRQAGGVRLHGDGIGSFSRWIERINATVAANRTLPPTALERMLMSSVANTHCPSSL